MNNKYKNDYGNNYGGNIKQQNVHRLSDSFYLENDPLNFQNKHQNFDSKHILNYIKIKKNIFF